MSRFWSRTILAGLACVFLLLGGCSGRSGRIPVSGSVTVDGEPGTITIVTFTPVSSSAPPEHAGTVITDDKGQFAIGNREQDTGLMPGEYRVTFSRFLANKGGKAVHGGGKKSEIEYDVPSKESISDEYRDKANSPITAKVSKSSTEFKFELSVKKK